MAKKKVSKKKTVKRKTPKKKVVKKRTVKKSTVKKKATKRKVLPKKKTATKEPLIKRFDTLISPIKVHSVPATVTQRLNSHALGYSLAIIHAVCLLVISILGKFGLAKVAVELSENLLLTYSLSIFGIIAGIAEAAVWGLVFGIVLAWLYNKLI